KSPCDCVERLFPGDSLEAALAFRADSSHRVEHAPGVVDSFQIAGNFSAEEALSGRVIGITSDFRCATVLDFDEHRACVRAIVRASGVNDFHFLHAEKE